MVEELFGSEALISKRGTILPDEAISKVKIIGMLFAKSGCPFTNEMVDSLISIYQKVNTEKKVLEVIYCQAEMSYCSSEEE